MDQFLEVCFHFKIDEISGSEDKGDSIAAYSNGIGKHVPMVLLIAVPFYPQKLWINLWKRFRERAMASSSGVLLTVWLKNDHFFPIDLSF